MTRTFHVVTRAAGGVLLALLTGCESSGGSGELGVTAAQFPDVVVPAGMKLRDRANESYSRDDGGHRMAHLVYSGQAQVVDIEAYLRGRMPSHNWQLVSETKVEEGIVMKFERSIYSVQYSVARSDGATTMIVDYATDYSRR